MADDLIKEFTEKLEYPRVLFLFGLTGAGKSYVGDLLGRQYGWAVYHADEDLLPEMKDAIRQGVSFTEDMRDRYFGQVAEQIKVKSKTACPLIVTQAAYKSKHRRYLLEQIAGLEFIWIQTSDETWMERIRARNAAVDVRYAQLIKAHFEVPTEPVKKLLNEGTDVEILEQFKKLFISPSKT